MDSIKLLLLEMSLSLGLSVVVLALVSGPLKSILKDLCPTESQAGFWRAYSHIMLVLAPLMLVLLVSVMSDIRSEVEAIKVALLSALSGLILGMLIIGKRLFDPAIKNQCES
jgi:FtsH-binding integral membrane protein